MGHFVLASSESFVIDFLEKEGLHTKQYVTQEIGDLATIDEAKQFVESLMLCKTAPSSFFDTTENGEQIDMWPRVYEICGGNIGLLERCGEYANDIGSWEAGLKWVSTDLEDSVQRGLGPEDFPTSGSRSLASWTEEDYKTVLREIVLAKIHAVSFKKLRKMVGRKAVPPNSNTWNQIGPNQSSYNGSICTKQSFHQLQFPLPPLGRSLQSTGQIHHQQQLQQRYRASWGRPPRNNDDGRVIIFTNKPGRDGYTRFGSQGGRGGTNHRQRTTRRQLATLAFLGTGGTVVYISSRQQIPYTGRIHAILVDPETELSLGKHTFSESGVSASVSLQ
ncbi:hypothetical protein KSW81_006162 [Nannochloris sp. 'desiccata']|nr:hypothetical protein KSW81_006162 [Chlorella desiccata (nom. nud.)]